MVEPQSTGQVDGQKQTQKQSLIQPEDVETTSLNSSPVRTNQLLPAFSARQYSHLPTPQSPHNLGQYVQAVQSTPESPLPHPPHTSYASLAPASFGERLASQLSDGVRPSGQQIMTPESSPFVLRTTSPRNLATPRYHPSSAVDTSTPKPSTSSVKLEPAMNSLAPAHRITSPISASSSEPSSHSRLSSPFVARLSLSDRNASRTPLKSRPTTPPVHIDDVFSISQPIASSSTSIHTPPTSPLLQPAAQLQEPTSSAPTSIAGGEIERIRLRMLETSIAQVQEAESRRPEYLKRSKRSISEADPTVTEAVELEEREMGLPGVGITVSPNKGRRLKLFQETSEESFEESLMAGGYGLYRTADWVRQPQPMPVPMPKVVPTNVIEIPEVEAEPTEKELRKRRRLAAFRQRHNTTGGPSTKLFPVELEGKGRVIVDVPNEQELVPLEEPSPAKKRGGNRRKKKGAVAEPHLTAKEKRALAAAAAERDAEVMQGLPNWPDAEFPWRLRREERWELARAENEEKLKWIEKFLDRDTDEEEEGEEEEGEAFSSTAWGQIYDSTAVSAPVKMGRGKMVPLAANPNPNLSLGMQKLMRRRNAFFPSDPADARAALLAKKSVRALSYRHQRKHREEEEDSDEEEVCICHGRDDGRELVQCDSCETWYHLHCIGIRSIAELGKEEDPWFCHRCVAATRTPSPSPDPEMLLSSEPTLVPTDEQPTVQPNHDGPFFHGSFQDSPVPAWGPPRTPTRSGDTGSSFSSGTSWIEASKHGPSTPQNHSQGVRVYTNTTPSPFDNFGYNESPFDPNSTPSRGIKFGAPFTTPKNNLWSTRANGLFPTPSRPGRGSSDRANAPSGGGLLLDDSGGGSFTPYRNLPSYDESPIRRNGLSAGRRIMESPFLSRPLPPPPALQDSPIMRSKGKERRDDRALSDMRGGD